ncbi:vacuolar protein-sorting-associated protein 37 homolog 1 isoform X2 [Physcomitrium patens]|uniref:VPS37 C-terminal domain-containing protein n=1 Tax=Physcomitrium patens TaxID=3218 RepID=A0A2K1JJ44_PHYPA|nr:vacuolar protein-sorting-associated protein 37 homolog 1-like isoform X2 [Physcomitrium patens]PNR41571.1 hypothetical protein PHYPA_018974 [Physcomitrium patens]|eukprot:XP_024394294.1 vacuolar protein-sorting-associated protein 37 homolog 1-like isoform X2 [Physcomitrella patens]
MNILGIFSRGGQHQQQGQPPPPAQSWYPPSVASPSSSQPTRAPPPLPSPNLGAHTSGNNPHSRTAITEARPTSVGHPSSTSAGSYTGGYSTPTSASASSSMSYPSNAAPPNSVSSLKEKSPEELTRLLNDKDAYNAFLHSLDEVRRLDTIAAELKKSTIDESRNNLARESELAELRTQCMIIRNTELAASREKFEEVDRRYKEVQANCSPSVLLSKLQDAVNETDEESENLHREFLAGEIELLEFIQTYRKQRILYHRRSLIRMAMLSSMSTSG